MKSHKLKTVIALILCAGMLFLLSACRESPTLEETVYTYEAPIVDEEEQMLDPEDEGEEDEEFDNETRDDAETERDEEEPEGLEGEENTASSGAATEYNNNSSHDWQAENAPTESTQEEEKDEETTTEEPEPEPELVPGDDSSTKIVVDASGREITLPSNVRSATAVGAAAQMVEMVGGSGRLIAADETFLSSSLAKTAFSDIGSISSWWQKDGSFPISDDNFANLLAVHPDVCFELSGQNTFTSAQTDALAEAGIAYVVLPELKSKANLTQAVSIVAECFTITSSGQDSASIAQSYASWVDSCIATAGKKTASTMFSGLYLAGWDSDAAYQLNNTYGAIETEGTGLAYAYSGTKAQLISSFMKAAGVLNESTAYNLYRDSDYVYVAPMFHQFDAVVSGSKAAYYSGNGAAGVPAARDLFTYSVDNKISLGENEYFPALIAADEETKKAVEGNWFWQFHPECVMEGGYEVNGVSFYAGIIGNYDIYVNPSGMLSWESSVESPLEALWVASKYSEGGYTLDEVKSETNAFYQQFFGVSLSDEQLENIFSE